MFGSAVLAARALASAAASASTGGPRHKTSGVGIGAKAIASTSASADLAGMTTDCRWAYRVRLREDRVPLPGGAVDAEGRPRAFDPTIQIVPYATPPPGGCP